VSGPEQFGFSDQTVKGLIQELPNASKCRYYQWSVVIIVKKYDFFDF
jgi:hypothetical protein